MAGLDGSVFNDRLPNTKIGFQISKQKVLNGTIAGQTGQFVGSSRRDYRPSVVIDLTDPKYRGAEDPIFDEGMRTLRGLVRGNQVGGR